MHLVASLIGRLGSSTFRLSTTAVSMSPAGSCFSTESAPRPLYGAFFVKELGKVGEAYIRHQFPCSTLTITVSSPRLCQAIP